MSCFTERWNNPVEAVELLEFTGEAPVSLCPCRVVSVGNDRGMHLWQNWLCLGTEMLRDAGSPLPADTAAVRLCLHHAGARCELPACSRAAGTGVTEPSA